ncbi:MAG: KGK domain-containing protein [Halothece sp. Uz-M2-17]|nr:KGK domain-containing protein [Halothece sp. Uz-M2-17]
MISDFTNQLSQDDIVFFEKKETYLFTKTFKVSDFIIWIFEKLIRGMNVREEEEASELTTEGLSCYVLQPGQQWKKGKIRIAIEFIPDEVESPLDDVRQGSN